MQEDESERDVTTYTVLVLDKNSAHIGDLSPGTTYIFRVQALSPDGHPGSYSMEHEVRTLALRTCPIKQQTKRGSSVYWSSSLIGSLCSKLIAVFLSFQRSLRSRTTPRGLWEPSSEEGSCCLSLWWFYCCTDGETKTLLVIVLLLPVCP